MGPRGRRPVTQCQVWALRIALDTPPLDHDLCFLQRMENLSIQAFVPKPPMEAFAVAIPQRTSWLEVQGPMPAFGNHCLSSFATNSELLSERMFSGIARSSITSARAQSLHTSRAFLLHGGADSSSCIHRLASTSVAFFRSASSRSRNRNSRHSSLDPVAAECTNHHSATASSGAFVSAALSATREARYAVTDLCQRASRHAATAP
jgi:hypothetical protein